MDAAPSTDHPDGGPGPRQVRQDGPDCAPGGAREGVGVHGRAAPGWYPDQSGRAPLRWWDGTRWAPWESDGVRVWSADERPRVVGPQDLESLRFVEEVFLVEARRRGVVAEPQARALAGLSRELAREARGEARPAPAGAAGAPGVAPGEAAVTGGSAPVVAPSAGSVPAGAAALGSPVATSAPARPPVSPPGRVARWWAGARERFDVDLTVHGLAYLGVLLLFVGVFGLVAFAFSDVTPAMRPVAELAVAVVPFVAAWVLARSGARFVARALVAVGGLLLPVMVVTSVVDGYGFPPDLHDAALPAVTAPVVVALALGYVAWTARRPTSGLGVMVAPVLWFAAAMGAVGLARPVPRGEEVAVPGGAQVAVLALAVLVTTALARLVVDRRPHLAVHVPADADADAVRPWTQRLAASALTAATPGVVVVGVLALVAGAAEAWPVLPFVVTVGALAGALAMAARLGPTTADVALLVGWLVVALRVLAARDGAVLLSAHVPMRDAVPALRPWLLLAVVVTGVALAELVVRRTGSCSLGWFGRSEDADPRAAQARAVALAVRLRRTRGVVVAVVVWSLVLLLLVSVSWRAWWTVAGAVLLMVWAAWRRAHVAGPAAVVALDVAAAVVPGLAVLALWGSVPGAVALLVGAALVLAAVPLARRSHGRRDGDRFWALWSVGAGTLVLVGSAIELVVHVLEPFSPARAAVPLAAVTVGAAVALGRWRARTRVAVVTPVLWWAWTTACLVAHAPARVLPVGLALAGLAVVLVAHGLGRRARRVSPMLGLAGHVTGAATLLLASVGGWATVVVLACATAGWAVTAVRGERGRSPVGAALDRRGAIGRGGPWVLVLLGALVTVWAALHASGALRADGPWTVAVPAATAVVYAVATRAVRAGRVVPLLPWAAFTSALLALLLSTAAWPLVASLGALVAQVVLSRGRHAVMVWAAWAAVGPLTGVAAWSAFPELRDLGRATATSGTAVAVGAALVLGALVVDRARPTDPRLLPRRRSALAPAVLGAGQLLLGVMVAPLVADASTAGVLLMAAAAAVGAVATFGGVGGVGAFAVLLAWVAAMPLLGRDHPGPWAHVAVAAALLAVAQGVATSGPPRVRWARWDVPLASAAAVPALAAVTSAPSVDRPLLLPVVGALCVVTAVRLHRRTVLAEVLGGIGTVLVLTGAAGEGPGWTALALAVLAAAHTALAAVRPPGRAVRRWVGAVTGAAAWGALVTATGLGAQWATDVTAVAWALAVLTLVGVVAGGYLTRSGLAPWGTVGVTLALAGALRVLPDPDAVAREWGAWTKRSGRHVLESIGAAPVGPSWWHVAAWLLLAGAAVLAARAVPRGWWLECGVVAVLGAVLTAFSVTGAARLTQVGVDVALSAAAAIALVLAARRGASARSWLRPLTLLGVATTALAGGVALGGSSVGTGRATVAGVLAAAAVQAAATGVAWRVLGLRMAAPVVGWLAWALYAAQALGDGAVVAWYSVPVGLALLVVVGVWRADRRGRGLAPSGGVVVGLELTGIAFLVVGSFVAAFAQSVLHAFVAAGIGVLVAVWGLLTRVRRRFVVGVAIVLAGVVLAVGLPLVALLPAWGAAGAWVLVAVVGVLAVVAATLLERGRAAVRDGRARLLDATAGWE